jgi:hypothetical protein
MSEHPILFNGEMVRAILDGRKTQTRRPIPGRRISPHAYYEGGLADGYTHQWYEQRDGIITQQGCRYVVGDRLWVRETWGAIQMARSGLLLQWRDTDKEHRTEAANANLFYRADGDDPDYTGCWIPSIHMPRWASRITLEVTDVRANVLSAGYDLNCITQADIVAEGFAGWFSFELAWDAIYASRDKGILTSPWVWAITFKRVTP